MAGKSVQAAVAANRDVPNTAPIPLQDCSDVIHIAVFFDGTGNNNTADEADRKWSNVARLYQSAKAAAQLDKSQTLYPIYISGVGTPYNGKAVGWLGAACVWVEDGIPGLGAAAGGDRRMEQGHDTVNEQLREVLIANAKALGGTVAKHAAENSSKSFGDLSAALAKHRLIKVINLSLFGFSRGAALARAFSNQVIAKCTKQGTTLLYYGYPLRLNFMGVFDTVASFGVPAQNARTPFTERDLIVSTAVERCVHYVAAHEVRFSFPVDLIRKDGKLSGEWMEKTYPGVHSDVGGGYDPKDQEIDNNYARIPMREMMGESVSRGVRMMSYEDIKKWRSQVFRERFECRPDTEAAYERYMKVCPATKGTIEQQITEHLKLYYSAHGTMHRRGIKTAGDRSRDAQKYKYVIGSKGIAYEVWAYRSVLKAGKWLRLSDSTVRGYAQYVKIDDWQLGAWDSTAPDGAVEFLSRYVHDSKVDFMTNVEPFSYFRPRGVEESSISVWQQGGNWLRSKAKSASEAVDAGTAKIVKAADTATAAAKETADVAARTAKEAADAAQRRAIEAANFAKIKANEAAAAANRAYDATAKAASDAADVAQQRAQDASDFASRKATAVVNAVAKAYDTASRSGRQTVAAGHRTVDELEDVGERIYESGKKWVQRKIKEVGDVGN
jgi:hypothetical protein